MWSTPIYIIMFGVLRGFTDVWGKHDRMSCVCVYLNVNFHMVYRFVKLLCYIVHNGSDKLYWIHFHYNITQQFQIFMEMV